MIACNYCGNAAALVNGIAIYPHRKDLDHLRFWLCAPCNAYVGCHKNSNNIPLGTLAKTDLRRLRNRTHAIFDPIWLSNTRRMRRMSRTKAYEWLANRLSISVEKCHIAMFNEETCKRAISICESFKFVI